jgi:arabinan endo-1,5-alpha-L-arabinosidase
MVLAVALFRIAGGFLTAQTLPLRGYLTAHDPSTITQSKNRYYLFYTGQGILSKSSADKVFWAPGPPVFSYPPAWTTNAVPGFSGLFWAPDLLYFNNQFHVRQPGFRHRTRNQSHA